MSNTTNQQRLAFLQDVIVAPKHMMTLESGDPRCPLWLLGDSNPKNWEDKLASPLDPRHPARHNIVTPVLDAVQDLLYRACRLRIETRGLYIRNAVATGKPEPNQRLWNEGVCEQVADLHTLLEVSAPPIVLTFGAFSFEFARRAIGLEPAWAYKHWDTDKLGEEFRSSIGNFNPDLTNLVPLLHISIARGKFLEAHDYFTGLNGGNYFEFVSQHLAGILITHRDNPRLNGLWIADEGRAAMV